MRSHRCANDFRLRYLSLMTSESQKIQKFNRSKRMKGTLFTCPIHNAKQHIYAVFILGCLYGTQL